MSKSGLVLVSDVVLVALLALFGLSAQAADLSRENKMARAEALREVRLSQGAASAAVYRHQLGGLVANGFDVGPLCIGVAGQCVTQHELSYRSSEYFTIDGVGEIPKAGIYTSIAEARFPGEAYAKAYAFCDTRKLGLMTLFVAIETKERLAAAYLESYTRRHPNRPARTDGGIHHTYSWQIDENGAVVELDHAEGDGD